MMTKTPRGPSRPFLAGLGFLLLVLTACGSGGASGQAGSGATPVTFAASAGPSSTGLLAAVIKGEGLDKKHGLNLQVSNLSPDQAEQAMLTGRVEAGFFAPISLAKVRAKGRDIAFLGPIQTYHGDVVVQADSSYRTFQDLRGKTIATLNPVSGLYTGMQLLAAEVGMSWKQDFKVISGPPPGLTTFIKKGEVDAIVHFEPHTSQLLATGNFRSIMDMSQAWEKRTGENFFMLGLAARQPWIQENPETATRLSQTVRDALKLLSDNPGLVEKYLKQLGLTGKAVDVAKNKMSQIYLPQPASELKDDVRTILERAKKQGIIAKVPGTIFLQPGKQ